MKTLIKGMHCMQFWVVLFLVGGATYAERSFFVNDNGFADVPAYEDQARILKELGYAGICTRPKSSTPELLDAFDRHGLGVLATYVTLSGKELKVPGHVMKHLKQLQGRNTVVWLMLKENHRPKDNM